ncbi:glycosyltransferase [Granulicella sp. S190]|uniref:glycosyltransferase n=1 Tax=Granulicella sp. S190 TaxID=1747226 RepID=UPI00131CDA0B|nr:glycosyltransferase [Granulicella sp. S190]
MHAVPSPMSLDSVRCVIVLYRTGLQESETFQTLCAALREYPALASRISLLIYDNSPEPQTVALPVGLFAKASYQHDPSNGGLATAYNQALHAAEEAGDTWLWLFDQDTTVLPGLIPAAFAAIDRTPPSEACGIVPRLVQDGVVLSPAAVHRFRYLAMQEGFSGLNPGWLTALNSCACLRVSALRAIGGFPPQYWLDFLDHAVFHRLHKQGGRLLVLDVTIPHRLSTNNLRKESSHRRFDNLLAAEWQFVRETGWGGGSLMHRVRLLKRAVRTLLTLREPAFALQVLRWSLR